MPKTRPPRHRQVLYRLFLLCMERVTARLLCCQCPGTAPSVRRQRGSAMVEFVVVAPVITLMGLGVLQYSLLFFAKNQINHATFMAARAGSVAHASMGSIRSAYINALIPLYGGGRNSAELELAQARAVADLVEAHLRIEVLNPTRESFDDYATDAELNAHYGARAIPNAHQAVRPELTQVSANSGQTLQDANLLKLRITHSFKPSVPLIRTLYTQVLRWRDPGNDGAYTQMVGAGRIPVVSHVTLAMQSDAVEDNNISVPGLGNQGQPQDPDAVPAPEEPPKNCMDTGCISGGVEGGGGGGSGAGGGSGGSGGGSVDGGGDGGGAVCTASP